MTHTNGSIIWQKNWDIGIEEIDSQHKEWVNLLNQLLKGMHDRQSDTLLLSTIRSALDYADFHFREEEALFIKYNYPESHTHKMFHKKFLLEIDGFRDRIGHEDAALLGYQILFFMKKWLIHHIQKIDADFGTYVNNLKK